MQDERRVLVVEDSSAMRQLLVHALGRIADLIIDEAPDGATALKMLRQAEYAVLVTDINMPVMDGLKLIAQVRQDDQHAQVPIVVITTERTTEDRQRALELGADAYISKPIRALQLVECVEKLLRDRSSN